MSVSIARLPEAGRWRSLFDFYVTTMRTAVAARLLSEHEVLDLTIEEPPIEDVIEMVFAQSR